MPCDRPQFVFILFYQSFLAQRGVTLLKQQINTQHPAAGRTNAEALCVSLCVGRRVSVLIAVREHTHTHSNTNTHTLCCVVRVCVGVFRCRTKEKVGCNFRFGQKLNCVVSLSRSRRRGWSDFTPSPQITAFFLQHLMSSRVQKHSMQPLKCPVELNQCFI